jgi:NTE family protein
MRTQAIAFALLFVVLGVSSVGAVEEDSEVGDRPKTCLVLSGGGALGAAHVGVIRVLEDAGVPVDCVVGTSMGAIVGALYATGYDAGDLEAIIRGLDMSEMFIDQPPRRELPFRRKVDDLTVLSKLEFGFSGGSFTMPRGLVAGQKFGFVFQELLLPAVGVATFDDLPIPYRAVATDVESGGMVVLDRGDLGQAVRASMSVPGAFSPVPVDGRLLVDGGLVRNLPVDVARAMGAEVVIAVDVGASDATVDAAELNSATKIFGRMLSIMIRENVRHEIADADIVIAPDLGEYSSRDFDRMSEMLEPGAAAAREKLDDLRTFALDDESFTAWRRARTVPELAPLVVSGIQVATHSDLDPRTTLRSVRTRPGDPLDFGLLWEDLLDLYKIGDFQIVDIHFERAPDGYDVIIDARPKSWGPNYVRFGINLEADLEGESDFNVLGQYLMTNINPWRGEAKFRVQVGAQQIAFAEYYQPLSYRGGFFLAPSVVFEETTQDIDLGGGLGARYAVESLVGSMELGYQMGRFGEVRGGLAAGVIDASPRRSESPLEAFDIRIAGLQFGFTLDQLDNPNFPREGYFVDLDIVKTLESLGSDDAFTQIDLLVHGVASFGPNTLQLTLRGSDLDDFDEAVGYAGSSLGGLFRLSGRAPDSLWGTTSGLGVLTWTYRFTEATSPFGTSLYVGATAEAGNAWVFEGDVDWGDLETAGSLFVGTDTFLGPVYLAYGVSDTGADSWYFYVGRSF